MRKLILLLSLALITHFTAFSQYWQQEVNYSIDVSLNDKEHSLDGFESLEYINNSPDTLHYIWFHLWPNAYKNDKTFFSDQLLENGETKFYFSSKEERGYINRLDFKVDNIGVVVEDHPNHIDIVKLILREPLPPGARTTITTPFHIKLPYDFSRSGHIGESYQITQWYPKPAVYDSGGWHPITYMDQGEFYSEFGSFDVRITVPMNYVVAATGELQNAEEKEWLKTRSGFEWTPVSHKEKISGGGQKTVTQLFPESSNERKTLHFKQNRIHDFAWFADKRFRVDHDTTMLASGKIIDLFSYYEPGEAKLWKNATRYSKDAIHHYSRLVGEYPYSAASVVQGPQGFNGGMEYPMITIISQSDDSISLDGIIAHELGHIWFYGILGSNERAHPWMDEGINSYYEEKYKREKHRRSSQFSNIIQQTKAITKTDQPIDLPAEKYNYLNYHTTVYYKTAEWMRWLESRLGTEVFNRAMQEYYRRWQFRHPQPEDFKKVMEDVAGKNLDEEFSYQNKKGIIPSQGRKGTKPVFLFDVKALADYGIKPTKELIIFGPALGANKYDGFMVGAFVTNVKLPPSRTEFFVTPMYATGSKRISGLGFLNHNIYTEGFVRKIKVGVNASTFTMDDFTGDDGKVSMSFRKIVPNVELIFRNKNPRSEITRSLKFKSFLIQEDGLLFSRDSVITPGTPPDTTVFNRYRTIPADRTLNQLSFSIFNNRVLYPYSGELKLEQGEDFVRAGFTGNYFFNYGKQGGLHVRLFAGKFFYTSSKTIFKQFSTSRYHLNMTGPDGYEDYTYSDYFIGRNEFEGFMSQQIMVRDGAFKVRTNLLADKVGRTDDWLIAANFNTSIPSAINPLSALPIKFPLSLFLDIGTEADAWKQNSEEDRFLYNAGIQLSLIKGVVDIYVPLLYSKVYKDYILSTIEKKGRFWKKISFSIDISNFRLTKIHRRLTL